MHRSNEPSQLLCSASLLWRASLQPSMPASQTRLLILVGRKRICRPTLTLTLEPNRHVGATMLSLAG